jgi:hypothetical protein
MEEGANLKTKQNVLQVARLNLEYKSKTIQFDIKITPSHADFIHSNNAGLTDLPAFSHLLKLQLRNREIDKQTTWKRRIFATEIWELWEDEEDHYVFINPQQPILREVVVEKDFRTGVVYGKFNTNPFKPSYPIPQDLEIVLFSNWLANYDDVILHASGIARNNKGYIFAGNSRVGKSTLVNELASDPANVALGEDQVVLRLIKGRFWVFGTPWHENPKLCSPMGVPLERLFFPTRERQDGIRDISAPESVVKLMTTAFVPYYRPDAVERILDRFLMVSQNLPVHSLKYQLGSDIGSQIFS